MIFWGSPGVGKTTSCLPYGLAVFSMQNFIASFLAVSGCVKGHTRGQLLLLQYKEDTGFGEQGKLYIILVDVSFILYIQKPQDAFAFYVERALVYIYRLATTEPINAK